MTEKRGRCTNFELCANATAQRIVALPDDAPFVCPKCSEPMEALATKPQKPARNRGIMIAVQAAMIVLGGGVVAYKLVGGTAPDPAPAPNGAMAATIAQPSPADAPPARASAAAPARAEAPARVTTLFRVAGSDVLGSRLGRRLAAGYLGLIGDSDIKPAELAGLTAIVGNQAGEHEQVTLPPGNSASGFTALLRGTADLALSVRRPTEAEIVKLASIADVTGAANEHVIAVQPVLVILNPANRLPSISGAQLRDILAGRVTDWSQLGEAAGPIRVVLETGGAAEADTAVTGILDGVPTAGRARLVASEADVAASVGGDPLALGLVSGGHEGSTRVLPIATAGGTPITPTEISVATEEYPLTRRLYLYAASAGEASPARRFIEYVNSPGGQAAVAAAGFVALTVHQAAAIVPSTASGRLRALVAGATRVSIDFRFQPGSTTLDSRSVRDVDRPVAFLQAQHASGGRLILAGFADGLGQPDVNLAVSQRRVDAVTGALGRVGVVPGHAAGFGAELPLADNTTADGRERNRRVEVYLAP